MATPNRCNNAHLLWLGFKCTTGCYGCSGVHYDKYINGKYKVVVYIGKQTFSAFKDNVSLTKGTVAELPTKLATLPV